MNKNELPGSWKYSTVEKVCKTKPRSGGTPLSSNLNYYSGDIPWVITEDLTKAGVYISKTAKKITHLGFENSNTKLFPKGTVLFAMYGSIGRMSIAQIELTTNQAILGLIPDESKVLTKYLYYYLDFAKGILIAKGRGGTQSNINAKIICSFPILLPPLSEQERIVLKLDRQMAQIETMKKEADKQNEFQEKIRNSYLNKIFSSPQLEKSRRLRLGDITKITSGCTPLRSDSSYYEGNIPWIKTGELQNNIIIDSGEKVTQKALDETSLKLNPPDTLLVAMYGQGKTRGMTGLVKIESTTNQACCAIYPNYEIFIPEYLQIWFMAIYESLRSLSEGRGGNQPNLNGELIKQLEVPFPDKNIQKSLIEDFKKILEISNEINSNIDLQSQAINQLSNSILNEVVGKYKIPDEV